MGKAASILWKTNVDRCARILLTVPTNFRAQKIVAFRDHFLARFLTGYRVENRSVSITDFRTTLVVKSLSHNCASFHTKNVESLLIALSIALRALRMRKTDCWTGALTFGLVNIPVRLHSAVQAKERVSFRLLHKTDLSPINTSASARKKAKPSLEGHRQRLRVHERQVRRARRRRLQGGGDRIVEDDRDPGFRRSRTKSIRATSRRRITSCRRKAARKRTRCCARRSSARAWSASARSRCERTRSISPA